MHTGFFDWGLELPRKTVPRRVCRTFEVRGRQTLAGLPGCIRRIWVTGGRIGRELVLRIYFDGAEVPHVEAPLSDFFGVMHNFSESNRDGRNPGREPYRMNTPFLASKPHNGFSCYFPMPFARSARVEVENDAETSSRLFYIIDWHAYPDAQLEEPMRFCARWRREAPVRDYQDDFLILDADGPGRLVGFVHSIDMLFDRHIMRWSHAGSDNIYLDGMGPHPAFLRGIGGEDTFGTSYGGNRYAPQSALFSDMPCYIQKNPEDDDWQKLVGYRFFAHDSLCFERSIHFRFGARAHDIATTVYWYSAVPVRPYTRVPPYADRLPGTRPRRRYDLPPGPSGEWWITGPFPDSFDVPLPTDSPVDPSQPFYERVWRHHPARGGFVVFNHVFRPCPSNANSATLIHSLAVARCRLRVAEATRATFMFGWDDRLVFRLNDGPAIDLEEHLMFDSKSVAVELKAGVNELGVSLTNTTGFSAGGWCFSFGARTADGIELLPQVEFPRPQHPDARLLALDFGAGVSRPQDGFLAFVPPYSEDLSGADPGASVDLICSPQTQTFATQAGPVEVTVGASDNTSLGFREHEAVCQGPFRDLSALVRSEVRANAHPGGEPVALHLILSGLPPGSYDLVTCHHRHSADEAPGPLHVTVNGRPIPDAMARQSAGIDPESIARLTIRAHGGQPILIVYEAEGGVVMNSLEVVPVA